MKRKKKKEKREKKEEIGVRISKILVENRKDF
jgi:hypothetical protein